ncbi:MAG: sodium:proton antiporter [Sneathiellaceae bacterium]
MSTVPTLDVFDTAAILVVLAAALGYLNHRFLRLPHTIGLTVMGALASLLIVGVDRLTSAGLSGMAAGFLNDVDFSHALLDGMLSFLLFAGALTVNLEHLKRSGWTIAVSATVGVLLSTLIVGFGFWLIAQALGLYAPLIWCLVFGALISPTDPVAVLSVMRAARVDKGLEARMTGESLFNDGVGVVFFTILLAVATGSESFSAAHAAELFVVEAGGGILLGVALGYAGNWLMKGIDEHNIEILITLAIVMGGYALASGLELSGPVAMATAGLLVGNHGVARSMSAHTAQRQLDFWSLIDELLNSVLFLLIGLEALLILLNPTDLVGGLIAIPLVLAARAVSLGLPQLALGRLAPFRAGVFPFLVWGGLRGGISIALALSLPDGPERDIVLATTYIVVIFSVVVQGLTIDSLVRHFLPRQDRE